MRFYVREFEDEGGVTLPKKHNYDPYMCARDGDHLMLSFQCDLCHFRNILGRDPGDSSQDVLLLAYIRRANLDAFWSREPSTVRGNLLQAKRLATLEDEMGVDCSTPPMGPFPLEDVQGIKAAILVLRRSRDPGKYEEFVQPATYRGIATVITNISRASVDSIGETMMFNEKYRTAWSSSAPSHRMWFSRFMEGIKRRTGQTVKQEEPITIDMLKVMFEFLEIQWENPYHHNRTTTARLGAWLSTGFVCMRGEETNIVEYLGTKSSLENLYAPTNKIKYFAFVFSGKTKLSRENGVKYELPCAGWTSKSHLKPGAWVQRLCDRLDDEGREGGFLFAQNENQFPTLADLADDFYSLLDDVKFYTKLIPEHMDVRESFGLWRSLRRGMNNHAINSEVPQPLINLINRWRRERDNEGRRTPNDMLTLYTRLRDLHPTTVKFSWML